MERESLLTILTVLLAGLAGQVSWLWPSEIPARAGASAPQVEHSRWLRLWAPLAPSLLVAAWLCGWALREPDPVPERVSWLVFAAFSPFALVVTRALVRALWSLAREPGEYAIATVGFIRPQVVFSPFLARRLDERVIRAALAHERMHIAHRDPLRIWLGQLAADLQWPSPSAQRRLESWLTALEHARDEEARRGGAEGKDLAAAVLACMRFHRSYHEGSAACAAQLTGEPGTLRARITRLLEPLGAGGDGSSAKNLAPRLIPTVLVPAVLAALVLGLLYGERVIGPLLTIRL